MSVEKFIKKLSSGVRTPANIMSKPVETERIIIDIPKEGNYIEILGHRIEGYDSWEAFLEHLKHLAALEDENKKLKKQIDILHNEKAILIEYLELKIEEAKLDRVYDPEFKWTHISTQETVYTDILNRIEKKGDKDE